MNTYRRNSQLALVTTLALILLLVVLLISGSVSGSDAHLDWTAGQRHAHDVAEQLRGLGYEEDHPVIVACQEWWRAERIADTSSGAGAPPSHQGEGYTTKEQRAEYPEAAYVWQLLKEAGLSDIHAAAILGNAMAESGGHTLAINVYQDVGGYWGAWAMSKVYYADVAGKGADAQVAKILATLGEGFYATTDVRSAARWFSDNWERPAVWSEVRADNAERALEYFGS